jgi:hypothetical protein
MRVPRVVLLAWFCLVISESLAVAADAPRGAQQYIREALVQMGGEDKIRAINTVSFHAVGHRSMVEESERPDGPYFLEYNRIAEVRDLNHGYLKRTTTITAPIQTDYKITITVADGAASQEMGGNPVPASRQEFEDAQEDLQLGPERILLTALAAPDLHPDGDRVMQSVPQHIVSFTWQGSPVHIFLNAYTSLPTAVEWTRPQPYGGFWSVWGDVTTRVYYSLWYLENGGVHYPRQWDIVRNGLPDRVLVISDLTINPALTTNAFAISSDIKAAYKKGANLTENDRPLGRPDRPAIEITKDIIFIPGAWNATLIRQSDGVVILEAPISSGYSAKVIAEAERRWPTLQIKAVVTTSDAWPHLAGVREYVARGIPIYALDLNLPILKRMIEAPHTSFPDGLSKSPRTPDFRVVNGKTVVGDGPSRFEIYPMHGETSERQMMIYFPEHRLLYGSDSFQKSGQSYFYPQTVWELFHAVEREKLAVDAFFMMHVAPTPWSELSKVIASAGEVKPGN